MLISYEWLQSYFPKPLPKPEELAKLLTFHAFEVEGIEKKEKDTVFDIKILPDRAHYCLCHRGVVGEVSAVTGNEIKEMLKSEEFPPAGKTRELKIEIKEPTLCKRYIGRVVENVSITHSPEDAHGWLKTLLEVIGQRSINIVVDSANFVMFDLGQRLHAFDADKVKGGITIRLAKAGEKITTLDNREVNLDEKTLLIADDEGPLAIAGIKGGKKAEVTTETKNIILESANFEPANIRKTSTRLNIKTDAQKRYENEITPVLAEKAMDEFSVFVKAFAKTDTTVFGEKIDIYLSPVSPRTIDFKISDAKKILGIEIAEEKIIELLRRLEIGVEKKDDSLTLSIPAVRLDLQIPEDIVEEIGRLYGYENIKPVPLPELGRIPAINKNFYYQNKIRKILTDLGYIEVYTYAFQKDGEVEIENPLASDKAFMRKDLSALNIALEENTLNSALIGLTDVRLFEIGKVFTKDHGEHTSLAIGFLPAQKKKREEIVKAEFEKIASQISTQFGHDMSKALLGHSVSKLVSEINLDEYIVKLPEPVSYDISYENQNLVYKEPSPFPFIVRDVALFVPSSVMPEEVQDVILNSLGGLTAKCLVKGPTLFDIFEKEGKKSLAFRMVFQSYEKTLTDDEANGFMNSVVSELQKHGWTIR